MDKVKEIIRGVCSENKKIRATPAPHISLKTEDWAITVYTVRVWCAAGDTGGVRCEAILRVCLRQLL